MLSLAVFIPIAALSGYLATSARRLPGQAARAGLVVGCFSAASGLILLPPIPDSICHLCMQTNGWALQHPLLWFVLTFLSVPHPFPGSSPGSRLGCCWPWLRLR